ncbi:MAG: ferritin [Gemmatimonadota bacterium]|nr:ferritin [Gemmatimonadota bacterium]
MQLSAAIQSAMNDQLRKELNAYYLYLSMAAYLGHRNYEGFASWMRAQATEEQAHAMKIFVYIEDRGGRVKLGPLDEPQHDFASPLETFTAARDHESKVSASIIALYELAIKEKDYASQAMLQWFITEQVEEEKTSSQIVETLEMVGDNANGLYMFDKELGRRGASA